MKTRGIFCVECWGADLRRRATILPLLQFLQLNENIPFIHRSCLTLREFNYCVKRFGNYRNYSILYLCYHGLPGVLRLPQSKEVSLSSLGKLLQGKCKNKMIFFGSCLTLSIKESIIKEFKEQTKASAILGYSTSIDFSWSSAFELALLSELGSGTPLWIVKSKLHKRFGGFWKHAGFIVR